MKFKTRIKLVHAVPKWVWSSIPRYKLLLVQTSTRPPIHAPQACQLNVEGFTNNTLPNSFELKDNSIIWYMFLVQCEEIRINHLPLLLVVTMPYACWFLWRTYYIEDFKWRLYIQFGVAFWRVVLREVYIWRAKSCLKGIEDFNLEHWLKPNALEEHSSKRCPRRLLGMRWMRANLVSSLNIQLAFGF